MSNKPDILLLSLSTFNETGGIQQASKTLSMAFHEACIQSDLRLRVISLKDRSLNVDERYIPKALFKGCESRRFYFSALSAWLGIQSTTLVLTHIHLLPIALLVKCFKPEARIIVLAHGVELWGNLRLLKLKFLTRYLEFWCVSRYTRKILNEKHHIPKRQLHILNNCLDPFFEIPKQFKKPDDLLCRYRLKPAQPVLLSLGRMNRFERQKGYDLVLNIMPALVKDFPGLCYLIAGDISQAEALRIQNRIIKLKLNEHVQITGYLPKKQLTPHYLMADVFVLPSQKEGFGLVYIEAAACGRHVICGNKDGSPDAVLNGRIGTLIDPSSEEQLYQAIYRSLSAEQVNKPQQIQQICLTAFSYARYLQNVINLLDYEY